MIGSLLIDIVADNGSADIAEPGFSGTSLLLLLLLWALGGWFLDITAGLGGGCRVAERHNLRRLVGRYDCPRGYLDNTVEFESDQLRLITTRHAKNKVDISGVVLDVGGVKFYLGTYLYFIFCFQESYRIGIDRLAGTSRAY